MCSYADSYKEVQQINKRADSKLFLEIVTCKYLCQCVEVFGVITENASEIFNKWIIFFPLYTRAKWFYFIFLSYLGFLAT